MSGRDSRPGAPDRWYRRLLLLYPRWWREQRGEEVLATLLESAEAGSGRPFRREVGPLLLGALRVRAGLADVGSPARLWRSALRVAVLLLVAYATAHTIPPVNGPAGALRYWGPLPLFAVVLGTVAVGLLAQGRYRRGLALAAAMVVVDDWPEVLSLGGLVGNIGSWLLLVAAVLALPLLRHPVRTNRRPLVWLLAVPLSALLLPTSLSLSAYLDPVDLLVVVVGLLLWSLADGRVAIGVAAILLAMALSLGTSGLLEQPEVATWLGGYLGAAVVLAGIGVVRIRQHARL